MQGLPVKKFLQVRSATTNTLLIQGYSPSRDLIYHGIIIHWIRNQSD